MHTSEIIMPAPVTQIPPKVEAAQSFLYFCHNAMDSRRAGFIEGDFPLTHGRELTEKESATYDSALNVLMMYFNGEMDFGDYTVLHDSKDDEDGMSETPISVEEN